MRSLSFIIFFIAIQATSVFAQSPHGDKFNIDCSNCHESSTWKVIPDKISFEHNSTGFTLEGQHLKVDCKSCHQTLIFSEAKTQCISCHTDIHQGTVGLDCARCHTPTSWIVTNINELHEVNRFPLVGAHLNADCIQCHPGYTSLNFEPIQATCFGCHSANYYATTNPNHVQAGFSTECDDCHKVSSTQWTAANFNHDFFPLIGGHKITNCFTCHQPGGNFKGLSTDCYSCHRQNYESTTNPNHSQAGFSTDCNSCHTIMAWSPASFNHNNTAFPLTGKHVDVACSSCHTNGYSNTPTDCYACHQTDFSNTTDPPHVLENISHNCSDCHTTNGWSPANFDHSFYPLGNRHSGLNCSQCHLQPNYQPDCLSCHQNDFNEGHHSGDPTDCWNCHSTSSWGNSNFDHNNFFPLTGAHTTVTCLNCHVSGYANTPTDCISCHQTNYNNTTNPNHQAIGISTDCATCHTTSPNWQPATFSQHDQFFVLDGAHLTITDCNQCHNNNYTSTPNQCIGCHQTDYNNTTNPNHQAIGISTDCATCHTTNPNWQPAAFPNHADFWPFVGAHIAISSDCNTCHNGNYVNPPNTCYGCHQSNYTSTTDPPHVQYNFSQDCLTCHNQNAWTPASFDHSFYPIGSHHSNLNCNQCHSQPNYQPDCLSCHQNDFNEGHNPGDPTICWDCHNTSTWGDVNFNHNNYWPLTGAHATLACIDCHANGYSNTPTECYACHETNYNNTTNPNHQTLGISTDCETCHTTNPGWAPATFPQHNQYFEIVGAHLNITDCNDCHNGNYVNPPNTCYGCHQPNYEGTTDPPHVQYNFNHDCLTCHTQNGWTPASFNHSFYPLHGQHATMDCSQCHSDPNYQPNCINCHLNDFLQHHNPGDPTDCWDCHGTNDWGDSPILKKSKKFD